MLHVVTGPPGAGKTTYVGKAKKPGDVVIDHDALAVALGSPDPHDHPPAVAAAAHAARRAAISAAPTTDADVWLIHSMPDQDTLDTYRQQGADLVTVDPGEPAVRQRLTDRTPEAHAAADLWYSRAPEPDKATLRTLRYWAGPGATQWRNAEDPTAALRAHLATTIDSSNVDAFAHVVQQMALDHAAKGH